MALLPVVLGSLLGFVAARRRRSQLERVQVAMEQVIDRLEHGEIGAKPKLHAPRPSAFMRIADEIKKSLGA